MGAVPSHLQDADGENKLKIVNKVSQATPRRDDNQDSKKSEAKSEVNVLISITRDKTVIISEGRTIATQTENGNELSENIRNEISDVTRPNELVLVTENSAAPIETTLEATPTTATVKDANTKITDGIQTDKIWCSTPKDVVDKEFNEPKDISISETSRTEDGEESEIDFEFDAYDPNLKGDPIDCDTALLERYGKYKVKLSKDTSKCIITAAAFLDTGDVVIIDRSNQRIKYIDSNFKYISSYELPHKPWAVCARGCDVYITMGNTQLQHVFVKDMIIEPERVIEIEGRCLGVCICGEFIAVGLQIGEISLIDTMGVPQKTIQLPTLDKGFPCNPWHLSTTREQNILVTDSDAESVFCINMESEVLFTYRMFKSPRGTAVDNQGNIIVAGRDETTGVVVVILSRDFELQSTLHIASEGDGRSLLTWEELEFVPYCVAYRTDNVVVLGGLQEALKIMRIVS